MVYLKLPNPCGPNRVRTNKRTPSEDEETSGTRCTIIVESNCCLLVGLSSQTSIHKKISNHSRDSLVRGYIGLLDVPLSRKYIGTVEISLIHVGGREVLDEMVHYDSSSNFA